MMKGICDTCDQLSELFQINGRRDANCFECHVVLRSLLSLYELIREVESTGRELPELGEQLTQALDRLASRVGLSHTFNRTVVLQ